MADTFFSQSKPISFFNLLFRIRYIEPCSHLPDKFMRRAILLLIFAASVFSACSEFRILPSPSPPLLVHVGITPSLTFFFQEEVKNCALQIPEIALELDVIPRRDLNLDEFDMIIQIGEPALEINGFSYQIGWEEIILIAGSNINVFDLDKQSINHIFSSPQQEIDIWTYPEDHEIRNLFNHAFEIKENTPFGRIAPDPEAMLESIDQNQNAIGYIPSSLYSGEIQVISLEDMEENLLLYPVLVLTIQEPKDQAALFINCLQQED